MFSLVIVTMLKIVQDSHDVFDYQRCAKNVKLLKINSMYRMCDKRR